MGNARLYEIMKEKDAIYAKEDFTEEDGIRASELEGEFAEMNGWEAESDAAMLLNGLGVDTSLHYKQMSELMVMRKLKFFLQRHFLVIRIFYCWMSQLTTLTLMLLHGLKNS